MNVLTTEHKNLSSNPTKNDRAVTSNYTQLAKLSNYVRASPAAGFA